MNELILAKQNAQTICTIKAETQDEKARLFNIISNPDKALKENINIPIEMTAFFVEFVEMPNEETGEQEPCPRVVIVDKNGVSYTSISFGIFNSLSRLTAIVGMPDVWEKPVTVVVKSKACGSKGRSTIILETVTEPIEKTAPKSKAKA